MAIPFLKKNITFTPFYFYNEFLLDIVKFYNSNKVDIIEFKLIDENDFEASLNRYYIDPISIPLILSLFQQLKKYHHQPINLILSNNTGTNRVLGFLNRSNFFQIAGNSRNNPELPKGKSILNFNPDYIGNFFGINQRIDHKVRVYSIHEDVDLEYYNQIQSEEEKRDYLIELYSFKVKYHFEELLYDNINTFNLQNLFIELLAELITNGVLHSKSDTFALMFTDRFKTKFSISDNGIGFSDSLKEKSDTFYYKKLELTDILRGNTNINYSENIKENIYSIFEILFYSMLKDRKGLFDLMCNVVLNCQGYFRIHTDHCQFIISNRMMVVLDRLFQLRKKILISHNNLLFNKITKSIHHNEISTLSKLAINEFIQFSHQTINKYNEDKKYSSIRIFPVKFRGVHIEVEIPNNIDL